MERRADIRLEAVSKAFGDQVAVESASFEAEQGAFVALLGPSGCGKSTTLRMIAGLESVTSGRIFIGGRDVTQAAPAARGVAMVFQSYALFPHLDVRENILFGLRVRKTGAAEMRRRLTAACDLLGLAPYLDRKPAQLSGGQQQRVALGRAIVAQAPVCLMDEPLSNLDAQLRAEMRREIRALQKRLGMTMIYVTHDQVEAMTMADRIILMNRGRIEQDGAPEDLYARPRTVFAARFIGTPPTNVLPARLAGGLAEAAPIAPALEDLQFGFRPENARLADTGLPARVIAAEYLGADTLLECTVEGRSVLVRHPGATRARAGDDIRLAIDRSGLQWFAGPQGLRVEH
ncbi:MAG: ABC transporter ATP-binding protein [Methylobacteriaceae bacterium]|nr:ABC transporter ATP-binding protein [Methylobacteriaceae bacterium]